CHGSLYSKLKESYSYLFEHSKLVDYGNKYVDLESHFMTYIKNISQDLQLDILCAIIRSKVRKIDV
ncbi:hypothetical protein, partial [Anoxybacillus kestanbolensis]|uniref:hypothetical protein n=1 Tax=Anoxybacillus kestanbolensis TaxID=227476 RepID=UPI003D22078D